MSNKHVRSGAELRKRAEKVDKLRQSSFPCPTCGKKKIKRQGNSRWECKGCGSVFAGGTYSLSTPAGDVASRLLADQKLKQ